MNASESTAFAHYGSDPARVARAVASVFRGAALCHVGLVFDRCGRQEKIGSERRLIPESLNSACDDMIAAGCHPVLKMSLHRATPFELLAAEDRPVHEPYFNKFVEAAHSCGVDSIFVFPLRNLNGELFVALGMRRERPLAPIEARLIHSYCLDALAALECSQMNVFRSQIALTPREHECLVAAGRGHTEKDTARVLNISPSTVHAHLESCKRKLRARNKIEAIVRAIQVGAVAPEEL